MRKAEMKKAMEAGTPVAIVPYVEREYPTSARKAVIVGLNATRIVYTGARWDFGGHTASDGVRVCPEVPVPGDRTARPLVGCTALRAEYETDSPDIVVGPRQVVDTWEEFVRKSTLAQERVEESRRQREDAETTCHRLAKELTDMGFPAKPDYEMPYNRGPGFWVGVKLDRNAAAKLVEQLARFDR